MRSSFTHRQPGQSLALVALLLVLVFLIMGLAIDGGLLYAQRRMMQNAADAACLAAANRLAIGQPSNTAESAAIDVVNKNVGPDGSGTRLNAPGTLSYASISELYSPAIGTGTALQRGIELSGPSVRVALQSPAYSYFMGLLGNSSYTVAARAHCSATAGGGAVPIAVARWRGFDGPSFNADVQPGLTTDRTLPQYYRQGNRDREMVVRDVLARDTNSQIAQWPGWGSDTYPGFPADSSGLYSQASVPATPSNPGIEVVIAGNGARPNLGDNSFTGPVVLDYRQTTFPQPLFYNGLTPDTSLNTYKDFATDYILGPYPGPDVIPGQQIGFYSGVSAGMVEKPFALRYTVGNTVTVLVYNGTIYNTPNFVTAYPTSGDDSESRNPAFPLNGGRSGCDINPTGGPNYSPYYLYDGEVADEGDPVNLDPAQYRLNVTPQAASTFKLRSFFSGDPAAWNDLQGRWNGGSWNDLDLNGSAPSISAGLDGRSFDFEVRSTRTIECDYIVGSLSLTPTVETVIIPATPRLGAETFYLEAQDTNTNKRRARYAFLNVGASSDDFYAYFPGEITYEAMEPGRPRFSTPFNIERVDGTALRLSDVSYGMQWFNTDQQPIGAPASVDASLTRQGGQNALELNVGSAAATGKEYYLRIAVTYRGRTHWAWYYVQVRQPLNNSSSISQFVYTLGYASFRITAINSNEISGRAVSGLQRPEDLVIGLQPRLVPWEE